MSRDPRFAYPIVLRLEGKRAVVVGGGRVAIRKARALADAGARVRIVAPDPAAELTGDGRLECIAETYGAQHLEGARLVVAATDDDAVNARVAQDARAAGALVNVVDRPALCDFIVPAQVRRGPLVVAVSTGGAAPAVARRLRERLEGEFGPEYATYLEVMAEVRRRVKAMDFPPGVRRRIFERLAEEDLVVVAREEPEAVRRAAEKVIADLSGPAGDD